MWERYPFLPQSVNEHSNECVHSLSLSLCTNNNVDDDDDKYSLVCSFLVELNATFQIHANISLYTSTLHTYRKMTT